MIALTRKAPIRTAADDSLKYFFIVFSEKIRLDVSRESSARQRIHMKNQALFSSKDKSKNLKCRLLQFLFGALRVKLNALFQGKQLYHFSFYLPFQWGWEGDWGGEEGQLTKERICFPICYGPSLELTCSGGAKTCICYG